MILLIRHHQQFTSQSFLRYIPSFIALETVGEHLNLEESLYKYLENTFTRGKTDATHAFGLSTPKASTLAASHDQTGGFTAADALVAKVLEPGLLRVVHVGFRCTHCLVKWLKVLLLVLIDVVDD